MMCLSPCAVLSCLCDSCDVYVLMVFVHSSFVFMFVIIFFFFQAEDGIRDLVRSRGLGDVYKRQATSSP